MEELLKDTYTWTSVSLLVVIGFFFWKGLKPMLAGLDKRGERIRQTLAEAEALRDAAEKTLAEYKKKQREALSEAEQILTHAKAEAKRLAEQTEKDMAAALARREKLAMDKIAQAEAAAMNAVRGQAVDAAIAAVRLLIKDNLDAGKAGQLIDKSIAEVSAKLN